MLRVILLIISLISLMLLSDAILQHQPFSGEIVLIKGKAVLAPNTAAYYLLKFTVIISVIAFLRGVLRARAKRRALIDHFGE